MDIDTSHSMSSEAAKYLRYAKQCAKAAEQTTDPKVRERLLKVVADLTAAAERRGRNRAAQAVLREQVSGVSNSLLLNLLQNFGQFSRLSFLQCGINLLRCRLDLAQCGKSANGTSV
jgi:hypothetical protein